MKPHVLVLGGGITGLTAAYRLARSGRCSVQLLEASERTGGIVGTTRADGRVLEQGPDCFLSTKPWARELAVELGLEAELVGTTGRHRRSFVLARGRLEEIPRGFHLIAPVKLDPFFASPILSRRGKLRALLELSLPPRPRKDESLESFVRRRFGGELFRRLADPLLGGIYTADPSSLSLRATMPQFLELEERYGSVTLGLRAKEQQGAGEASGARYGLFLTFRNGQEELTRALARSLPEGCVRLGAKVERVSREERWHVDLASGERLVADAIVCALPAPSASRVLREHDAALASALAAIPYASAATVNLVFRREDVKHPLDAMGFVAPRAEKRYVLACTFSSTKFDGRAGDGEVLLRAFVGGAKHPERASDPRIVERVVEDVRGLLGIVREPRHALVWRHPGSMPQYLIGHLDRVAAIDEAAARHPSLALAGNAYRGVGIPDCVRSANDAARKVLEWMGVGPVS